MHCGRNEILLSLPMFVERFYFSTNQIRCNLLQICEVLREVQTIIAAVSDVSWHLSDCISMNEWIAGEMTS